MEFWLSFNNFAEKLQLPVNPREFHLSQGNKNTVVDIQGLGELNLIGHGKLAEIQLSSFFPSKWAPYCAYRDIPNPYDATSTIERWRKSRRPVRLIITNTPINVAVSIEEFKFGERAGSRDVEYTLKLKEYRFITVETVSSPSQAPAPNQRPNDNPTPKTYVVKPGDSLVVIAKMVYGDSSKWRAIYDANKNTIGTDPNLIRPGQQLVIA